jgi:hypothetical protein
MKKTLLLITLLVTSYNLFAFTTQGVWRWRNDDGSETSATWKAAQNTPITISSAGENFRLRIEMYNNGGSGLGGAFLEDSMAGSSKWDTLRVTPTSSAFMIAGASAFVTDLELTTEQLNGQGSPWSFTPGYEIVSRDTIPTFDLGTHQKTEIEWVIKTSSNIQTNTTYYFRVDAANYDGGNPYPSLTTASVLAVNFSAFNLKQDKNGVQISWTTGSEQNNNHFDIERSSNGSVFTKIATIKGNNNSTTASNYSVYDSKPLNGINYYRIKQVDNDGKVTISAIKSINISSQKVIVKAYPNPTHGDITFSLNNYNGAAVTATLNNNAGKMVHQEVIQLNGSGSYKLNLQSKLVTGVYFLQLKGDALSENLKVVVQ